MDYIRVRLIHPAAQLPSRVSSGSAGYDLYASEDVALPPSRSTSGGRVDVGRALVPTGVVVELPKCTVGRIGSRSGLSVRYNIEAGAGWIDSDYRGQLMVELKNFSSEPFQIARGDRIAQLIILPVHLTEFTVVEEISETTRGAAGLGSSGVRAGRSKDIGPDHDRGGFGS